MGQFLFGLLAGIVVGLVMEWVIDWTGLLPRKGVTPDRVPAARGTKSPAPTKARRAEGDEPEGAYPVALTNDNASGE